jgi:hypothetical protein
MIKSTMKDTTFKPLTVDQDVAIQVQSLKDLGERLSKSPQEARAFLKRIGSITVNENPSTTRVSRKVSKKRSGSPRKTSNHP